MTISFKDTLGTVGIDWESLQEGNAYQVMPDAATIASNPLVVSGQLGGNQNLTLQYPITAAEQSAWLGVTVTVINGSAANNIQVARTTGGADVTNVTPGQTGVFMLTGGSQTYGIAYLG